MLIKREVHNPRKYINIVQDMYDVLQTNVGHLEKVDRNEDSSLRHSLLVALLDEITRLIQRERWGRC